VCEVDTNIYADNINITRTILEVQYLNSFPVEQQKSDCKARILRVALRYWKDVPSCFAKTSVALYTMFLFTNSLYLKSSDESCHSTGFKCYLAGVSFPHVLSVISATKRRPNCKKPLQRGKEGPRPQQLCSAGSPQPIAAGAELGRWRGERLHLHLHQHLLSLRLLGARPRAPAAAALLEQRVSIPLKPPEKGDGNTRNRAGEFSAAWEGVPGGWVVSAANLLN